MIEISKLCKSFDQKKSYVVNNFNLTIQDGETVVLLGTSGCGKTTSLKMINRLISPTSGVITIDGINILKQNPVTLRRNIGYVFQGIGLFPNMTVGENVAIKLKILKKSKQEQMDAVQQLLELVNLAPEKFANRRVTELSGGQQQRVGVARALANDPKYLLMDEPFAALDSITRNALQLELIRLKKELHKTIVFVTHDIFEAFRLADRIVVMDKGRIQQVGTKEELINNPKTEFVNTLIQTHKNQLETMHNMLCMKEEQQ